ncbi:MAG: HNH endonuclease signature motif containing protein [Planctomycetota bacterium]
MLDLVDRKQGGRFCVLCREQGLVTPPDVPLVIDHLQPLSKGGDNHWTNLRWLCASHNSGRCNRAGWRGLPAWHRRRREPS